MNNSNFIITNIKNMIAFAEARNYNKPRFIFLGKIEYAELDQWAFENRSILYRDPDIKGTIIRNKILFGLDIIEVNREHFLYVS